MLRSNSWAGISQFGPGLEVQMPHVNSADAHENLSELAMRARQANRNPIIVMGVSGCGKTSIARLIAAHLDCRFVDGDDLHDEISISKMTAGVPLNDSDRHEWLIRIGQALRLDDDNPPVVACSALRVNYRELLRKSAGKNVTFLYLKISRDVAHSRLSSRVGHFMPAALIESQFTTLDEPSSEIDVITIGEGAPEDIVRLFFRELAE